MAHMVTIPAVLQLRLRGPMKIHLLLLLHMRVAVRCLRIVPIERCFSVALANAEDVYPV